MNIDVAFSRSLLSVLVQNMKAVHPDVSVMRDAWVWHFNRNHWEFHGPNGYYWHGRASCAYEARYKGWMAWLEQSSGGAQKPRRNPARGPRIAPALKSPPVRYRMGRARWH